MIINSMKLERSQNGKRINSDKPITVGFALLRRASNTKE